MYSHISVFDLDHTLLKVNSSFKFGSYLYKKKIISFSKMLFLVGCYACHKAGILSVEALHRKVFRVLFKGRSLTDYQHYVSAFLDAHFVEMLYQPAYRQLQESQKNNHYTAILSSSPDFLVLQFAERLKVDEWGATRYTVDCKKHFFEVSDLMDGQNKARHLMNMSDRLQVSLKASTAYSDSVLDMPFLEAAGRAVGVNPEKKLRALCKQNQWDII